ncbi:Nucleoside 5-triphosphatase RdgB (dHAPTP, dITP, XTP-specific) [Arcticibacter svalbardensis MN12-7]|uniref:dITP/XTP pyrophosphatase n=1 Tax=Arcticibacter svalbardensis MN12-7 TaxID=1150600 RepID=R9GLR1_9SPHI|nr:RdgB/HAM1 family non-canonical purine NTP pyrophosphatase [Arcticibacter svalbardensis]EOR92631.1 Nucleoside 5-triphosphatase RdgB (dHAPTP, dITP, XTP-specific) [Arcticibacter svalbardensis MN12-7]
MTTLVFATNNLHKLEEVQALIGDKFLLKTLNEIGCTEEIPETGHTFIENASQKSHYIFNNFKEDCFSDDSGLEVDALNGEPGVYSARYSGSRDPETNLLLVLEKMKKMENRTARFKCIISLIINGQEHIFEGSVEGAITQVRSGTAGFGYDGIFQPEGYNMTFADMTSTQKNGISHRAKAVEKLVAFLNSL